MSDSKPKKSGMNMRMCRGFPMPGAPWFNNDNMEAAMDYVPLDEDIILCSYPKTGTTWMSFIMHGIIHGGKNFSNMNEAFRKAPYLEFQNNVEEVKKLTKPRFYKHHYPLTHCQWNPKAKYVYVLRHPEDVIASYYPFSKETSGNDADINTFFEHFMEGNVAYGKYFDNINSFYEHKNDQNLLFVFYEDLKRDPGSEILRIAEFLGEEYHQRLVKDPEVLEKVLEMSSLESMKKVGDFNLPMPGGGVKDLALVREGKVGGGKKILSQEQRDLLKKNASEELPECLFRRWYAD